MKKDRPGTAKSRKAQYTINKLRGEKRELQKQIKDLYKLMLEADLEEADSKAT